MKYVKVIPIASDDTTSHVVYLNQSTGDDTTAVIDDITKPAKTLQKAITLASTADSACEVRIVSDYVISGSETISKNVNNKVVVTCANGAVITGFAASPTTTLEPHIIKDGSVYKQLAANCHKLDVEHYLPFTAKTVTNQSYSSSTYTQEVTLDVPSGYTVEVGMLIDLQIAWVNATGVITAVSNGEITATFKSSNYQMKVNDTGKYRIENYGSDSSAFKFTKSGDTYTISGDTTNVKTIQPSRLSLSGIFNLVFKDCVFEGLDKDKTEVGESAKCGISVGNCYALRFEHCEFHYCDRLLGSGNKDMTVNDCYFHNTNMRVYCTKLFVRNSLFKTSELLAGYGGVIENNTFCYSFKGINGGTSRREVNSSSANEKTIIQRNEFHHIGLLMQGDYGAIYFSGQTNLVIQYNYLHDCIGGTAYGSLSGIYFDEGCYGILARYNLVVNCTHNSYTHYGRGNVFYNNLFAYPAVNQLKYSASICYEGATSYIANIFYKGNIDQNYMENLVNDNAAFQFNVVDRAIGISDSHYIHSNVQGFISFKAPAEGDFEIDGHSFSIGKVTGGSSNVRNYNQSMVDTTFIEKRKVDDTAETPVLKIPYGLPVDSQWQSEIGISVDFTQDYDTWFIQQEMAIHNVTNEYLQHFINE